MNEDISLISIHPLVRRFVLNIVRDIREKRYSYEVREVVHADMVPRVSEKVMQASMGEKKIGVKAMNKSIVDSAPVITKRVGVRKRDMSELVAPIKVRSRPQNIVQVAQPVSPPVQAPVIPEVSAPAVVDVVQPPQSDRVELKGDYGKIMPLLGDETISTIDCPGPDKPIFVVRMGQREITKISLNVLEIKELLEKFADVAHVPLMEGVFRVSVDGMNVSAVVSEMLGTKFVIKKATAYNLLE